MMLQTLSWTGSAVRLLNQTKLPTETVYVEISDEKQMWDAIKRLVVRGAPAIGVAAAFGAYLGVRGHADDDAQAFLRRVKNVCDYLASSRPTAVNLFWALDRIQGVAREVISGVGSSPPCHPVRDALDAILAECVRMVEEDTAVCRAIGEHGFLLLQSLAPAQAELNVLTHCNAGGLATVQYGTALAAIYVGAEKGRKFHVYADETRPLLQGSRITAYELKENGIPVTVICDSMAATVMKEGKVSAVIVGTDRVAANGDVANKIGTLGVAILAKHFGIPFFVAAPTSSIDLSLPEGGAIPIEQRDPREVSQGLGRQTAPDHVDIYNLSVDRGA
jgi:methylthioribose-1-phosphate isomerase